MTDLDEFEEFFKAKGVKFARGRTVSAREAKWVPLGKGGGPRWSESYIMLHVTKCGFVFDVDGRFVGTNATYLGYFLPRSS